LTVGALFSIGAIASQFSFVIPIGLRVFSVRHNFRRGPWHLGKFSYVSGIVSVCFAAIMIPILNLPTVTGSDLTPATMNWTCLVYFGPMLIVMTWWFISARHWFKGPKVASSHAMLGDTDRGDVLDGKGDPEAAVHDSSSAEGADHNKRLGI